MHSNERKVPLRGEWRTYIFVGAGCWLNSDEYSLSVNFLWQKKKLILHDAYSCELSRKKHFALLSFQPVLCEASYALLEYVKTAMFMWMFIEGLFLHNMVTGMYTFTCTLCVGCVNLAKKCQTGKERWKKFTVCYLQYTN